MKSGTKDPAAGLTQQWTHRQHLETIETLETLNSETLICKKQTFGYDIHHIFVWVDDPQQL